MIIPWQQLENDTLQSLIESYLLREGTDYGEVEYTLQEKVAHIRQQLESGEIVLQWSELHESVTFKKAK